MKFEFNWSSENCLNILMALQIERPWLKGQRSTLTFEIVSLGLTYQVTIMTLALIVFKK